MKKYIVILLASQCCALTSAYAANLPAEMMFEDKPIDSLCFDINENNGKTIDLQHCGANIAKYIVKGQNAQLSKEGFIGYDWQDASMSAGAEGYTYYKFFPGKNKKYWIYTINNGGGSGVFTALYNVQRKDPNTLTIDNIAGGDRCNGGIDDVTAKNHGLTFSVNLTSYDLLQLADNKLPNVKPYDDLAACAACCVAKAFFTLSGTDNNPQFTHVSLSETVPSEMSEQGKYAICFNKLLASFVGKNSTLDQVQLNAFAMQFKQTCVH